MMNDSLLNGQPRPTLTIDEALRMAKCSEVDLFHKAEIGELIIYATPLATSKSPTFGHPKSPRQDGQIMSLLRRFEQIGLLPL